MLKAEVREVDYEHLAELAKGKAPAVPKVRANKSAAKKLWDNYQVICEVQKNDRLKFVIAGGTREGYRCLSIREFYYRAKDNTWNPSREGILIPLKSPLYKDAKDNLPIIIEPMSELLAALPAAIKFLEEMPLHDPEHEMWLLPNTNNRTKVRAKETSNED